MGVKTAKLNQEFEKVSQNRDLFSDFNHIFLPHPNTGEISRKTNVDAVKLAIRNIVLTNKYERLRNPNFGGNISRFLFEPVEPQLAREIEDHIKFLIEEFEPRANIINVHAEVSPDESEIYVNIVFSVITSGFQEEVDLTLYRVR